MPTRAELAIILSRLVGFDSPDSSKEQYMTDSETASKVLWNAYMLGDIEDKTIADLGCGPGILGIGSILLGAKKVYFVDIDEKALNLAKANYDSVRKEYGFRAKGIFMLSDICKFSDIVDTVIMNPPFGVQKIHADKPFLEASFRCAGIVYSMHKVETRPFVEAMARENFYHLSHVFPYDLPLKKTMVHHKKMLERIPVAFFRLSRIS
jgi:putative methylase